MLCSKCSEPVLPVVAVDIDGTLARYHQHFFLFASEYLNQHISHVYSGLKSMHEHMGVTKEMYRQIKLAYRQGGMKRSIPTYTGADDFMFSVGQGWMELWITTTRPYMRMDNIDPDTREWIKRNGYGYDTLIYDEDKYATLAKTAGERVVAVVEDEVEQYDVANELGLNPILVQRSHNVALIGDRVSAPNLHVARRMVVQRAENWRKEHA